MPTGLTSSDVAELRRMQAEINRLAAKIDGIRGPGVRNLERSLSISPPVTPARRPRPVPASTWFFAQIGTAVQDGTNKRWAYEFVEVEPCDADEFCSVTGAREGTAYNLIEIGNGATGTYFNGVSSTNLTGTFALQKCPADAIVVMYQKADQNTGTIRYFFQYENGIDGAC